MKCKEFELFITNLSSKHEYECKEEKYTYFYASRLILFSEVIKYVNRIKNSFLFNTAELFSLLLVMKWQKLRFFRFITLNLNKCEMWRFHYDKNGRMAGDIVGKMCCKVLLLKTSQICCKI